MIVMVMVLFNIRDDGCATHPYDQLFRGECPSGTGLNFRPLDYSSMPGIADRVTRVTGKTVALCSRVSRDPHNAFYFCGMRVVGHHQGWNATSFGSKPDARAKDTALGRDFAT
jgi:hypothetical protein